MEFSIEKKISNFIESQFPQFYLDEGAKFVDFVKAYYEWMENEGTQLIKAGPVNHARNLYDYRDIDNTLNAFLEHFQRKYLYGIPFKTITDPRLLLKHVLDVYRSKGSIQCYKLLFRLLYNEDCEVYLPSSDILRISDGTWVEPKYLEVIDQSNINRYLGQVINGTTSHTQAVVENIVRQPVNGTITVTMYISHISPLGGAFIPGEKIVINNDMSIDSVDSATTIIGSLNRLEITNGGQGFRVGDVLKIIHRDLDTNQSVSYGMGAEVRVTETFRGQGALTFFIKNKGDGYMRDSNIRIYNADDDAGGHSATFKLGPLAHTKRTEYNTDLIMDHLRFTNNDEITLDSLAFEWSKSPSANISSTLSTVLSYSTNTFGSVHTLTEINPGNNYIRAPKIFVETTMQSNPIPGEIYYKPTSVYVKGSNTNITSYFQNNRPIFLQANSSNAATAEFQTVKQSPLITSIVANTAGIDNAADIIKILYANSKFSVYDQVYYTKPDNSTNIPNLTADTLYYVSFANSSSIALSSTLGGANVNLEETRDASPGDVHTLTNKNTIELYAAPFNIRTSSAQYRYPAPIYPSNFALNETIMKRADRTVNGLNLNIIGQPSNGNDIVQVAVAYNSGKGYVENEEVTGYLFNSMKELVIVNGGTGYSNDDLIVFSGGGAASEASGFVSVTDNSGVITETVLAYTGSGYENLPYVKVKSTRGKGAILKPSITAANTFNTYSKITGLVVKGGVGKLPGYWSTTRGFLNSDKYIQDSNFYQDFSYQIRTALQLEKYKNILYNTFHVAGSELFGEYYQINEEVNTTMSVLYEQNSADTIGEGYSSTLSGLPVDISNVDITIDEV